MVKPWDVATIGDFLDFKNGLNKGKEFFGYGTPIVNYTDVYKKRGLKKADIRGQVCLTPDEIHRFDVRKNDVFFTRTSETPDEVGMSAVLLEDVENGVFSGFVLRGRPKNDMFVPEYCKYCFSTEAVRNAIITGCTYTTRALTNGKQLSAIEIPVPPKSEQEAIAAALSDIDTLIANLEKLIAKKKAIKQGTMQELLSGSRRLKGFSTTWKSHRVGDLGAFYSGLSGKSKADFGSGTARYITFMNVLANAIIDVRKLESVRVLEGETQNAVEKDDLFFNTSSETPEEVGMCAVLTEHLENTYLNSFCFGFRITNAEMYPLFLSYYFNSQEGRKIMSVLAQGATRYNLSKAYFSDTIITVPEKDEQIAIASILSDMEDEIEQLHTKLKKYQYIKFGMMSELLTGRIRLL